MPRVLFLNRFFYPDHAATSQLLSDLAFDLVARGWDVTVIAGRTSYSDGATRFPARERVRGVDVYRVATTQFGRGRLVGRAIDYLGYYISSTWHLWRLVRRGDIVVAKTDPPLISVFAAPTVWLRGGKLVNWLQDLFPDVAMALKVLPGGWLTGRALTLLRNHSLRRASNVVLGQAMAQRMREVNKIQPVVIENWADASAITPLDAAQNRLRSAWGLDEKFVIGYSGNMGRAHSFGAILDAATELISDQRATFLFIGAGPRQSEIVRAQQARQLNNIVFKPYQKREALAESLSVPDVHLVSLEPSMEGLIVPSKIYGIMAAGRPILFVGDVNGEIAHLLREEKIGMVFDPDDGAGLARQIRHWMAEPETCRRMGARARALILRRYDKKLALQRWHRALSLIAESKTSSIVSDSAAFNTRFTSSQS